MNKILLVWTIGVAVLLVLSGILGGMRSWGGPADDLPLLVLVAAIPAYAVFSGACIRSTWMLIILNALMGCLFGMSSYPYYPRDAMSVLGISIAVGVVISFIVGLSESAKAGSDEWMAGMAERSKKFSLWGIIFFGQIAQPLALHYGLESLSRESDDTRRSAAKTGVVISSAFLVLLHVYWIYILFVIYKSL